MNDQELENIRSQSDAPTLILMFVCGLIFIISMFVSKSR
jgi:hypothetical protein